MFRSPRARALLTACLLLVASGCAAPDAVSKFCTASNTTLTSAEPILEDLKASCLRRKNLEQRIGTFSVISEDPGCTAIGAQSDAAVAVTEVLSDYFTAINSLATVGTATTGTNALTLVSKTGAAVGGDQATQDALSSIAGLIVSASTGAYQQRNLNKDLVVVSGNIGHTTEALVKIVNIYIAQLDLENTRLSEHYKDFSLRNTAGDVTLELDARWRTDTKALTAKKAAAYDLITALNCIKKGSAELARSGKKLKAKEVPALLDPYITQLQTLIPQLQKAF